jgi:hypothetical protein
LTVPARVHGGLTTKETELVSIKNQLIRAAAVGALGVATMAGFMAPASAAARVSATAEHNAVATAAVPNTNIAGSPAKWNPTKLTVKPSVGTKCTAKNESFTITNKTKKSQTIQFNGGAGKTTVGTLPAGKVGGICLMGSKGASGKFFIKGAKSVLTVTLS